MSNADLAVYAVAHITKKTAIGVSVVKAHRTIAPLVILVLACETLSCVGWPPLRVILVCIEGVVWMMHSLFSCQLISSNGFQLRREHELARICCYLLACLLLTLNILPM